MLCGHLSKFYKSFKSSIFHQHPKKLGYMRAKQIAGCPYYWSSWSHHWHSRRLCIFMELVIEFIINCLSPHLKFFQSKKSL
jgi:hypothetical protein